MNKITLSLQNLGGLYHVECIESELIRKYFHAPKRKLYFLVTEGAGGEMLLRYSWNIWCRFAYWLLGRGGGYSHRPNCEYLGELISQHVLSRRRNGNWDFYHQQRQSLTVKIQSSKCKVRENDHKMNTVFQYNYWNFIRTETFFSVKPLKPLSFWGCAFF